MSDFLLSFLTLILEQSHGSVTTVPPHTRRNNYNVEVAVGGGGGLAERHVSRSVPFVAFLN